MKKLNRFILLLKTDVEQNRYLANPTLLYLYHF